MYYNAEIKIPLGGGKHKDCNEAFLYRLDFRCIVGCFDGISGCFGNGKRR